MRRFKKEPLNPTKPSIKGIFEPLRYTSEPDTTTKAPKEPRRHTGTAAHPLWILQQAAFSLCYSVLVRSTRWFLLGRHGDGRFRVSGCPGCGA